MREERLEMSEVGGGNGFGGKECGGGFQEGEMG